MISNGKRETSLSRIQSNSTWEGGVWYYDGAWVFFQIADYIGASHPDHQTFLNGAKAVLDITYRSYAMGQIPGYRVFAHGLEQDFLRNGNLASKNAVYSLSKKATYCCQTASSAFHGDWNHTPAYSREIAYGLQTSLAARRLHRLDPNDGYVDKTNLAFYADLSLGYFTQWMQVKPPYTKPFMMALTAHALIEYAEQIEGDSQASAAEKAVVPKILPGVLTAFNWMWESSGLLDAPNKRFFYSIEQPIPSDSNPADLNLLIAPIYAWLYHKTGDEKHRIRADILFSEGVDKAWLGQGKQFSQSYRLSFLYLNWRK